MGDGPETEGRIMSEQTTDTAQAGEQNEQTGKMFTQEEVNEIVEKRLARDRAKLPNLEDLKAKADKFDEIQEANKTEQQKLQEQLQALSAEKSAAEARAQRLGVIAKYQIPEEFQDLVHGDTEEALSASAEKVAALVSKSKQSDGRVVVPGEGERSTLALNGDGIERALKDALGIQ